MVEIKVCVSVSLMLTLQTTLMIWLTAGSKEERKDSLRCNILGVSVNVESGL